MNFLDTFEYLTEKQVEVMDLLLENRTSKEIAHALNVSESAIVQRIEVVRQRAGGRSRSEVIRAYRRYVVDRRAPEICNNLTGGNFQLSENDDAFEKPVRGHDRRIFTLSDATTFQRRAPWQEDRSQSLVPEVLDGDHALRNRWLLAIALAIGMLALIVLGLAAATALGSLI